MKTTLTVVEDFGDYKRGDRITDAEVIAKILASNNACRVVATPDDSQF